MRCITQTAGKIREVVRRFVREEEGVGVVEIVLILVILVGLVLIFQEQISDVVSSALESFSDDADTIID